MCVSRDLVGIQLGWHNGDKVLKHVVGCREWSKKHQWKEANQQVSNEKEHKSVFGSTNVPSVVTFSVPSSGLMIPGISSPKDRWSIRWEKLYAAAQCRFTTFTSCLPFTWQCNQNFIITRWEHQVNTYYVQEKIHSQSWLTRAARWAWPLGWGMDLWRDKNVFCLFEQLIKHTQVSWQIHDNILLRS